MRAIACLSSVFLTLGICSFTSSAAGDVFGSGANEFEIEFVPIGSPGNPPDANPNPAGPVPYRYRIGKYEISEQMIDKANVLGGLGITKDTRSPDKPATSVTWYEAARFVNWLNTSTGNVPAYKFVGNNFQLWQPTDPGYDSTNLYRNSLARYFLPSINEWHKAAYYDPTVGVYYDYPTGSDSVPDGIDFVGDTVFDAVFYDRGRILEPHNITNVGLLSPYGTASQGGNIYEWLESAFDRTNDATGDQRRVAGGGWGSFVTTLAAWDRGIGISPSFAAGKIGFRLASVIPEPGTAGLLISGSMVALSVGRRISRRRRPRSVQHISLLE